MLFFLWFVVVVFLLLLFVLFCFINLLALPCIFSVIDFDTLSIIGSSALMFPASILQNINMVRPKILFA